MVSSRATRRSSVSRSRRSVASSTPDAELDAVIAETEMELELDDANRRIAALEAELVRQRSRKFTA